MYYEQIYHRQLDVLGENHLAHPITIIGAGSVGSAITLVLAKMGFNNITVYDFDNVEPHNIPNQLYGLGMIGKKKVKALKSLVSLLTPIKIKAIPKKFEVKRPRKNVLYISAVDSLKTRKEIVQLLSKCEKYIDTRMGLEVAKIYYINPRIDLPSYMQTLYKKPVPVRCTAKSIMYTPFILAGRVGELVKQIVKNEIQPPFKLLELMPNYEVYYESKTQGEDKSLREGEANEHENCLYRLRTTIRSGISEASFGIQ